MKKAFTLIETLLYLALFSIIFFSVVTFTISITESNSRAEYKNAVEKNAIYVSEHLAESFALYSTIDSATTIFDSDNSILRLGTGADYKQYSVSSGMFRVTQPTTSYDLLDSMVQVTQFRVVEVLDSRSVRVGARITMTFVSKKYPTIYKTIETFYAFR